METKTISAELTEEQYKKYETLQENDISIGRVIDLIFELRAQYDLTVDQILEERVAELENKKKTLAEQMESIDKELGIIGKVSDTPLDPQEKQKIIRRDYGPVSESYEMKVQAKKHKITWEKDFFKL